MISPLSIAVSPPAGIGYGACRDRVKVLVVGWRYYIEHPIISPPIL
jgi:hypothetical protein